MVSETLKRIDERVDWAQGFGEGFVRGISKVTEVVGAGKVDEVDVKLARAAFGSVGLCVGALEAAYKAMKRPSTGTALDVVDGYRDALEQRQNDPFAPQWEPYQGK